MPKQEPQGKSEKQYNPKLDLSLKFPVTSWGKPVFEYSIWLFHIRRRTLKTRSLLVIPASWWNVAVVEDGALEH